MENSLMHYGRKGMKWGQHIYGDKKGSVRVKRKKELDEELETAKGYKQQSPRQLAKSYEDGSFIGPRNSDDVPDSVKREVVQKKNLDKQYKEAMKEDDPETSRKREVVNKAKLEEEYKRYSPEGQAKAREIDNYQGQIDITREARNIASNTKEGFREAGNLADQIGRIGGPSKQAKIDISTMSNKQLQDRVNRIRLEQQYADLHPGKVSRGAGHVKTALGVVGSIAGVASAAIGTAASIMTIKLIKAKLDSGVF